MKKSISKCLLLLCSILFCLASFAADNPNDPNLSSTEDQPQFPVPTKPVVLPPDAPYGYTLCHKPGFTCIPVPAGSVWYQLFPNQQQREIAQRLNRTNVSLSYRHWLVVPQDWQHFNYMAAAPFPDHRDTGGKKLILVDLSKFAFAAYNESGYMVYWGPAAGGKDFCEDVNRACKTATGTYTVYRKEGVDYRSKTYPIDQAAGQGDPMPYSLFYHRGFAIHGTPLAGFKNRSHGCVHLITADAKWLYNNFASIGTEVIVKS